MKIKKELLKILWLFVILFWFFFVIFYLLFNIDFFWVKSKEEQDYFNKEDNFYSASEETQISKEALLILQKQRYNELKQEIKNKELLKTPTIVLNLGYFPEWIKYYIEKSQKNILLQLFLNQKTFKDKNLFVWVDLYKDKNAVRWKLKDKKINLYNVLNLEKKEFFSVFIHEFGHYVDLYYFQRNILNDISDDFYAISWEQSNILKPSLTLNDFVSGYAMTNKYEDFAESFAFYILFNDEFLKRSQDSEVLNKKYLFFRQYVFTKWEFVSTNFFSWTKMASYNRDSTKIEYNLENILNYLKKSL